MEEEEFQREAISSKPDAKHTKCNAFSHTIALACSHRVKYQTHVHLICYSNPQYSAVIL